MITGLTLQEWGFKPGRWFKEAIVAANVMRGEGQDDDAIRAHLQALEPQEIPLRTNTLPFDVFLDPETELERANLDAVIAHMDTLMRVPTIVKAAVMPDACPSGSQPGTIPVGGAVACENAIHPGFHSSDICCSVAITVFKRKDDLAKILDVAQKVTHFGPTRKHHSLQAPKQIADLFAENDFLKDIDPHAQMGTQGDGNHFLFVGTLESTGQPALVTHHGSRGVGAMLYKRGMAAAKRHTGIVAPRVPDHQSWLPFDSEIGQSYWQALQIARVWTKANHFVLHDAIQKLIGNQVVDRFWNEHNFVFLRDDGLIYHGKGATPSWKGFSADDDGRTLIPLNMAEPILITGHTDKFEALGFAPHGAGRNLGRKAFLRDNQPEMPSGIDARFYSGLPDLSELPAAYKNAAAVTAQIEKYGLAEIKDRVLPFGCIMAGEPDRSLWKKPNR